MTETSKTQIDRLGDRLRKGDVGDDDLRRLDAYRRSFADAYEDVVGTIRSATQLEPTGRPAKSTTSIVEKLRRETIRLSQVQDIAGCRLVVQDVLAQDRVVEQLKGLLPRVVVVDRRKQPTYGYRAVHIIATARDKPIEIQVRTELQHLWAQLSEKLSDVIDPSIKYGGGDPDARELLTLNYEAIGMCEDFELENGRELNQLLRSELGNATSDLQHRVLFLAGELAQLKQGIRQRLEDLIARFANASNSQGGS